MKTAIKIVALVEAILLIVCAVGCLVGGIVCLALSGMDFSQYIPADAPEETAQAVKAALVVSGILSLVALPFVIVGSVFCFRSVKLAEGETNRKQFITWGVLDIIFASAPVGIMLIVEGAVHGNRKAAE